MEGGDYTCYYQTLCPNRYIQKNLVCSPYVSIEPIMERSLIIELEKNHSELPPLWSDDMDIETLEVFGNSHLGGTDQRSCSF